MQIEALYRQRKAENKLNNKTASRVNRAIASKLELNSNKLNIKGQYQPLSFIKIALLTGAIFILALPIFSLLLEQVTLIKPANNMTSSQSVELFEQDNNNTIVVNKQYLLPKYTQGQQRVPFFNSIVANTEREKLTLFNQQVEVFLATGYKNMQQQQQLLYASSVRKGKLVKQKDLWFIEFCGEQMLVSAQEIIEDLFLADPYLDETRSGDFYDIYSNQSGVLAMLATPDILQCN